MADSDPDNISEEGEEAMVTLYGGSEESLDERRYRIFIKKVASQKKAVQPSHTSYYQQVLPQSFIV